MRRVAFPCSVVALALLVFVAWMHPTVLWPTNVGWLLQGYDRGQSAIGLAAYLRSGGPWPLTHQPLLNAPEGMTLLFTDSIPLLGLLVKPFATWLPPIQLVGTWYLLCVLLQAGFAAALVRARTSDALVAWLGTALLTLMPVLLNRYAHASLCAQWLILWALWVFVDQRRSAKPLWWVAVLGTATLVHSYLLLLTAAMWASALLPRVLREPGKVALAVLPVLAVVLPLIALHGVIGGDYDSTGTYGAFPAALDAWWNPANSDYTALLPSSPQDQGRGFEGLQYMGAGLLLLVVLAVLRLAASPRERSEVARLAWLLPAAVVLAIVAIGPQPMWRGEVLGTVRLPAAVIDALDPVRASGRLMWPATYALAVMAVVVASRMRHAALLLGAALAVQVVDLAPMIAAIRPTSSRADDPRVFARTLDPRWSTLVGNARAVQFEPAEPFRDLQLMEEIEWRAVVACRPVRYAYSARDQRRTRERIAADARAFRAGTLDPTRLYVLLGADPTPPAVASRVRVLDGVRLVPPSAPAPSPGCLNASEPPSAS